MNAWIWGILLVAGILGLAFAIRKATRKTPFANNCGCTPNIDHLRWVEKGEKPAKKEERW